MGWPHVCHSVIITHLNVPPLPSLTKHTVGGMQPYSRDWDYYLALRHCFISAPFFLIKWPKDLDFGRGKIAHKCEKWEENAVFWRAGTVSLWESRRLIFEPFLEIEVDEKTKSSNFLLVSAFCQFRAPKDLDPDATKTLVGSGFA